MAPRNWKDSKKEDKYVTEPGELMCRYPVNGKLCPCTAVFKSRAELSQHLKQAHEEGTVVAASRGGHNKNIDGLNKDKFLTNFYADLVSIMQGVQQAADSPDPAEPDLSGEVINIPTADADEDEDTNNEDEDDDDDPPAPSNPTSAAAPQGRWIVKGLSTFNYSGDVINPQPYHAPESGSRLSPSMTKGMHDDWDPEVLRKTKEEARKFVKGVSTEGAYDDSPGSIIDT